MQRRSGSDRRSGCPISISLELFGDPWSLLIVRDLMFKGLTTFKQFQAAGEGVASNILSDRLTRLERAGIVTRTADPVDARRVLYRLTEKGADLAPVLIEIVLWSARYEETEAPPAELRRLRSRKREVIAAIKQGARGQRAQAAR